MKQLKWYSVMGIFGLLVIAGIIAAGCTSQAPPFITGHWKSTTPEDIGNGVFATRDFTIGDKDWSIEFDMALDKGMQNKVMHYHAEGPYSVGSPSTVVSGANDATFSFTRRELTLLTPDGNATRAFGFDTCNLKLNEKKDITSTGCSFIQSVGACGQEYDLVKTDGSTLYLGARPADNNMCTPDKRPVKLGYPLVRINP